MFLFIEEKNPGFKCKLDGKSKTAVENLIALLADIEFTDAIEPFTASDENPNFKVCLGCMEMVQILPPVRSPMLKEMTSFCCPVLATQLHNNNHTNYAFTTSRNKMVKP